MRIIIYRAVPVFVVHSIVRQVRMVHQVLGPLQKRVVILEREQVGHFQIPRAVAVKNLHQHAITVIKKNPAGWRDFLLTTTFVFFLFFDRHGGQWACHHSLQDDFFTRYNTETICAVGNAIQGRVYFLQ